MVGILLYYALEILKWLIIVRALMSWFVSPYSRNVLAEWVRRITDPILRPIAGIVPPLGGVDVSPLVAFFVIYLLQQVVVRALIY